MSDKIFCGSAKIIKGQYGPFTKVSFSFKDLEKLKMNLNDAGWVNAVIKEKKKENQKKDKPTHYLEIDDYVKPEDEYQKKYESKQQPEETEDDLPF